MFERSVKTSVLDQEAVAKLLFSSDRLSSLLQCLTSLSPAHLLATMPLWLLLVVNR